jgi:hypothetical protein
MISGFAQEYAPDEYEGEERNRVAMDKAKGLVREVAGIVEGNEETKAGGCLEREEGAAERNTACFRNSY